MKDIGLYFVRKYRARLETSDVQTVARQLRKQGISCEMAILILARGPK